MDLCECVNESKSSEVNPCLNEDSFDVVMEYGLGFEWVHASLLDRLFELVLRVGRQAAYERLSATCRCQKWAYLLRSLDPRAHRHAIVHENELIHRRATFTEPILDLLDGLLAIIADIAADFKFVQDVLNGKHVEGAVICNQYASSFRLIIVLLRIFLWFVFGIALGRQSVMQFGRWSHFDLFF